MERENNPNPTKGKVPVKNLFKFLHGGKERQENHSKYSGWVIEGNTEEENNGHVVFKLNIH